MCRNTFKWAFTIWKNVPERDSSKLPCRTEWVTPKIFPSRREQNCDLHVFRHMKQNVARTNSEYQVSAQIHGAERLDNTRCLDYAAQLGQDPRRYLLRLHSQAILVHSRRLRSTAQCSAHLRGFEAHRHEWAAPLRPSLLLLRREPARGGCQRKPQFVARRCLQSVEACNRVWVGQWHSYPSRPARRQRMPQICQDRHMGSRWWCACLPRLAAKR